MKHISNALRGRFSASFKRNRHRAGWRGRIYLNRRFIDVGWYHYDPTGRYLDSSR